MRFIFLGIIFKFSLGIYTIFLFIVFLVWLQGHFGCWLVHFAYFRCRLDLLIAFKHQPNQLLFGLKLTKSLQFSSILNISLFNCQYMLNLLLSPALTASEFDKIIILQINHASLASATVLYLQRIQWTQIIQTQTIFTKIITKIWTFFFHSILGFSCQLSLPNLSINMTSLGLSFSNSWNLIYKIFNFVLKWSLMMINLLSNYICTIQHRPSSSSFSRLHKFHHWFSLSWTSSSRPVLVFTFEKKLGDPSWDKLTSQKQV